ncbi:MAG: type II secretion system protein [Mycobacteriales bacterium]
MRRWLRRAAADRGETLIESLVTISVLGIAITALLGAITLGVRTSVLHRKHTQAQAELRNWAEKVSTKYLPCGVDPAGPGALPPGLDGQVTQVRYWDGTKFGSSCATPDQGLEVVTLRINVAAGLQPGFSRDLDVVVRKP